MIRAAQEKDLIEILDIYNDAIVNTTAIYDYKPHSIEQRKQWYINKLQNGYPVIVFEKDDKIIGFGAFGPFRPFPAYQYTIEHSVYVHKGYRNLGVGKALLKELISIANNKEFATMVGVIDSENESSIIMHKQFGFTYSGTITKAGYKFGKWLDVVFYQLELKGPKNPVEE